MLSTKRKNKHFKEKKMGFNFYTRISKKSNPKTISEHSCYLGDPETHRKNLKIATVIHTTASQFFDNTGMVPSFGLSFECYVVCWEPEYLKTLAPHKRPNPEFSVMKAKPELLSPFLSKEYHLHQQI